ncbi:PTS sugar transporter subunit IIA [Arthrobacter sp. I2-34]|uniref:PTS sugar transporter subunit IIA n=1 Tax=Arthrobacter hankyongi TaxID=2904801 RepID=A0ABS9L4X5_9MICC|nr:PTS sugar transporter subunit IIA [Arthrobacter hankyongi]MCG2621732.1 PTS sugar transporter subunit IIA [Arthrobacter hankyongi]
MNGAAQPASAGTGLTTPDLVVLELDAQDRAGAAAQLAARLSTQGRISDLAGFLDDVNARESQLATGLPGGVGLPHARSRHVERTSIAVGITRFGRALDFGAADGPADLILLVATPAVSYSEHLQVLVRLARSLAKEAFRDSLRRAHDREVVAELMNSTVDFSDV